MARVAGYPWISLPLHMIAIGKRTLASPDWSPRGVEMHLGVGWCVRFGRRTGREVQPSQLALEREMMKYTVVGVSVDPPHRSAAAVVSPTSEISNCFDRLLARLLYCWYGKKFRGFPRLWAYVRRHVKFQVPSSRLSKRTGDFIPRQGMHGTGD